MIDYIFEYFTDALNYGFWFSVFASFAWGILSIILSPCHLSSIPLVVGFLTKRNESKTKNIFLLSLIFSAGILVTIIIIGVITALSGKMLGDIGTFGNIIVSFILIYIGLYLMDIAKIPLPGMNINSQGDKGYFSALTLGLLFGLGLGPCTFAFMAPVIVIVFKISSTNLFHSVLLLLAFAAGHCLVITLAGVSLTKVQALLNWNENTKVINIIKKIAGALVVLAGIYLMYVYVL